MAGVAAGRQLRALAVANARFWPTVAPAMWRSLGHWRAAAGQIPDPALRRLALGKLAGEAFNAEVAATLATLAPRRGRAGVVQAIVALEVLFDYLDGRTEELGGTQEPVSEAMALFGAMSAVLEPPGAVLRMPQSAPDGAYLAALSGNARSRVERLASFGAMQGVALAAARRCAQAQSRLHAAASLGDGQLEQWAREGCAGSGLGWREYAGGCASSVLAVHALIAAGARPGLGEAEAAALDGAYLAIGALITMLDSAVDEADDRRRGEPGYIRLFAAGERAERARSLTREALARAAAAPDAAHHAMTLGGVVAYYAGHPGAGDAPAREVLGAVCEELGPALTPTLAVMGAWRAGKALRARAGRARTRRSAPREGSGAEARRADVE